MDSHIRELLKKIVALQDDLATALHERESQVLFSVEGGRIQFRAWVGDAHRRVRRNVLRWLTTDRPLNLITGPVIYAMAIPLAMLDISLAMYQAICFPIYGMSKVHRADYIAFDRHHLGYLNFMERFHCEYCAYANGLIAYATEIAARTEQYFCPIKHARNILGVHRHYAHFLEYGESADFHKKLEELRVALAGKNERQPPARASE